MTQMNISLNQKQANRHREQTCGCQGGGEGGIDLEFGISRCKQLYIEWINMQIFYQLSHHRGPRILEWVAYPFPSSLPHEESKQDLLHCRRILYQLSYQGIHCIAQEIYLMSRDKPSSQKKKKKEKECIYIISVLSHLSHV